MSALDLMVCIVAVVSQQHAVKETGDDLWSLYATAPGAHSRRNTWNAMFNVPPLEEARVAPVGVLTGRFCAEASRGDFRKDESGGVSRWDYLLIEESVQVDYGVLPRFQAGLRLSAGGLQEGDDELSFIEDGSLVTEEVDSRFALNSIVVRAKYAEPWDEYLDWGCLVELKWAVDGSDNPLAAGTTDLGMALCGSRHLGAGFWMHVQVGAVVPFGSTDIFATRDDPSTLYTGAFGVTYRVLPNVSAFMQAEGNTSGFRPRDEIDRAVGTFSAGARVHVGRAMSIDLNAGFGGHETSSEWFLAVGVNAAFFVN